MFSSLEFPFINSRYNISRFLLNNGLIFNHNSSTSTGYFSKLSIYNWFMCNLVVGSSPFNAELLICKGQQIYSIATRVDSQSHCQGQSNIGKIDISVNCMVSIININNGIRHVGGFNWFIVQVFQLLAMRLTTQCLCCVH